MASTTPPTDASYANNSQVQAIATMGLYYPASLYCPRAVYEIAYAARTDLGDAIHACTQVAAGSNNSNGSTCPGVQIDAALPKRLQRKPTIKPGRAFTVRIRVAAGVASGGGGLQQTAVALTLPEGVEYRKGRVVRPRSAVKGAKGGAAQQRNGVVYWPGAPASNSKNKAGKMAYITYRASLVVGCVVACQLGVRMVRGSEGAAGHPSHHRPVFLRF